MGKSTRKCQICPYHNKKHYNQKQKDKCRNEQAKKNKKQNKSTNQNTINNTQEKDNNNESCQIKIIQKDKSEQNFPYQFHETLRKQPKQFGPYQQQIVPRIIRTVRREVYNLKNIDFYNEQQIQKKIDQQVALRIQKLHNKPQKFYFDGQNVPSQIVMKQIRLILSQKQPTVKFKTPEQLVNKVKIKILEQKRNYQLTINPCAHFVYKQFPTFKNGDQLNDFVESLSDFDVYLYDPNRLIDLLHSHLKWFNQRQKQAETLRSKMRTRRSILHSQNWTNVRNQLKYEFKKDKLINKRKKIRKLSNQSLCFRKYHKTGRYTSKMKKYHQLNKQNRIIHNGWIKSIKRREKRGQYRFRMLDGDNIGFTQTSDKKLMRLRHQLFYFPWSRLWFTKQSMNDVFFRRHTDKKVFLQQKKKQRQNKKNKTNGLIELEDNNDILSLQKSLQEAQKLQICRQQEKISDLFASLLKQYANEDQYMPVRHANNSQKKFCLQTNLQFIQRNVSYMQQNQKRSFYLRYYENPNQAVKMLKKRNKSQYYWDYMYSKFLYFSGNKQHQNWVRFMQLYQVQAPNKNYEDELSQKLQVMKQKQWIYQFKRQQQLPVQYGLQKFAFLLVQSFYGRQRAIQQLGYPDFLKDEQKTNEIIKKDDIYQKNRKEQEFKQVIVIELQQQIQQNKIQQASQKFGKAVLRGCIDASLQIERLSKKFDENKYQKTCCGDTDEILKNKQQLQFLLKKQKLKKLKSIPGRATWLRSSVFLNQGYQRNCVTIKQYF